jgi:hypothetical protein
MPRASEAWLASYLARQNQTDNTRTDEPADPGPEKKLHWRIIAECDRRGFPWVHARMDLPHTVAVGTPDFVVALPMGRTLWIECKSGARKLTPRQQAWMRRLTRNAHQAHVVRSFRQFLDLIKS